LGAAGCFGSAGFFVENGSWVNVDSDD
jgi:hypothetical protein